MMCNRRGVTRSAGLAVVAGLAVLAGVLIFLKFNNEKPGPGVAAVPLTASEQNGPAGKQATEAKLPANSGLDRDMEIAVVDAVSKQPIPGAALTIQFYVHNDSKLPDGVHTRKEVTESKGRGWVLLPDKDPGYLNIRVKMDGYINRSVTYREGDGKTIPTSYTFELERGTSIGGLIHDEQGNPIAGAEVVCLLPGDGTDGQTRGDLWESSKISSDQQGRWRCDEIQKDLKDVTIKVSHPDFISDLPDDHTARLPMDDLRAMKGVIVMKRGLAVVGVVSDQMGKPIADATVAVSAQRISNQIKLKTDADGHFVFKNSRPGSMRLTATARGYTLDVKQVKVGKEMEPVEFRLARGNLIQGKVIDVNGKPLRGVLVGLNYDSYHWMTTTKPDGTFAWAEAPDFEMKFDLTKEGYLYVQNFPMSPSQKQYLITLRPPQKWHGSVVDAETGKPMESFLVVPGRQLDNSPVFWDRSAASAKKGQAGQYQIEFTQPAAALQLSIEVPGYLPAVSPLYKMDQSDVVFDAKLKKGTGPTGIVRLPDGKPAAGVQLALLTPTSGLQIRDGQFVLTRGEKAPTITSGADGNFEFPPQIEPFVLLAAGDGGYGEITAEVLKAAGELKLQPWGKVVGKLMKGSKPWPNETVTLNYIWANDPQTQQIPFEYETRCDQQGNFVFDRVVPREMNVTHKMGLQKLGRYSTYAYSYPQKIDVKSGQTVSVQVGGKGRPLIGKVKLPDDPACEGWNLGGTLQTKQPRPTWPEGYDEWTAEQIQQWQTKYRQSEQFKAQSAASRYYAFAIEDDGSFRVEDVLPGAYEMQIRATDPATENRRTLALTSMNVTIGQIPGGQSDQPLDVGTVEFKPPETIKPGADLSKVNLETIDGTQVKLADLKGKLLMIYFWSSRNKTVLAELPVLQAIYDEYGKNGRLVMIGLCTNSRLATGKAFAQINGMNWTQAYVGINSTVYEDFGNPDYPAHLLIGPDGKLINNVTRIENLKQEVTRALEKAAQ